MIWAGCITGEAGCEAGACAAPIVVSQNKTTPAISVFCNKAFGMLTRAIPQTNH
jgi:hypothetical protein